ncbi:type II toxin-antitoxin system RelE/ParE family toxin [Niveibacterium sp. SC-1]|uniref:type II toxin-antitoxin system RelE/ParE family toxin n=1 Tax=Niveibacterium sp. SC-1 TaxID=3135646 RepID=UPI00311E0A95
MWDITAVLDGDCCPVLDGLDEFALVRESDANGMFDQIERLANLGHQGFNIGSCHYVDEGEHIYQLRKGNLRLLFFYGGGNRIIVCSHVFMKSSQKTPASEITRAIAAKHAYFASLPVQIIEAMDHGA